MMYGYLGAVVALAAIPIGALGLLLMMDVIGGTWRDDLRGAALRVAGTLPWVMLLFLPLAAAVLTDPPFVPEHEWTGFRTVYLNRFFVVLRTGLYAVTWIMMLRAMAGTTARRPGAAAGGLIVYVLTTTLAAVDWIMAPDPAFSSSIFGLLFLAHAMFAGLAATVALELTRESGRPSHGALLLTALLLWAYMHAMQFLIFWTGNKPHDAAWYLARGHDLWGAALWFIALCGLVLPFAALLSPARRAEAVTLRWICGGVLAALAAECWWLILPAHDGGWRAAAGAIIGVSICGATAFFALRRPPVRRAA